MTVIDPNNMKKDLQEIKTKVDKLADALEASLYECSDLNLKEECNGVLKEGRELSEQLHNQIVSIMKLELNL